MLCPELGQSLHILRFAHGEPAAPQVCDGLARKPLRSHRLVPPHEVTQLVEDSRAGPGGNLLENDASHQREERVAVSDHSHKRSRCTDLSHNRRELGVHRKVSQGSFHHLFGHDEAGALPDKKFFGRFLHPRLLDRLQSSHHDLGTSSLRGDRGTACHFPCRGGLGRLACDAISFPFSIALAFALTLARHGLKIAVIIVLVFAISDLGSRRCDRSPCCCDTARRSTKSIRRGRLGWLFVLVLHRDNRGRSRHIVGA
mmetsp:Transcript_14492/g.41096  ORF Transcript_14492/g.41096 Transcript_14492/m.41096 type:complete len:256 (-) Transcript_14492:1541-2308(-)